MLAMIDNVVDITKTFSMLFLCVDDEDNSINGI